MKKIKYQAKEDKQEQNDFGNSAYWEKRVANHIWSSYNSLEEENYALLKHYEKLSDDIRLQLYSLTEQEKSGDLTRTQRYLKAHLQELQNSITKKCEELGDKVESEAIKNISKEIKSDYQNSFIEISDKNFHQLSTDQCKEIINNPWHGSYFSKRIWNNTAKLAEDLNQILSVGITEGKTIAAMAIQLANRTNQELNKAHRLIRTETINSLNRSALRGYKDAGVQFVRWWAAVDERTCEVCGENHGKVYPIDKAPNLPCHPGCRCTWLPVFEEDLALFNEDLLADLRKMQQDGELPAVFKFSKEKEENLMKVYAEIDRRFMKDGNEHLGMCYADSGKLIGISTSNEKNHVVPNENMIELIINSKPNSFTLIHNHPKGTPISIGDIMTTLQNPSIQESIVINSSGEIYFFSVGNGVRIDLSTNTQIEGLVKEYRNLVISYDGDRERAIKDLCKKGGWDYGKDKK